MDLFSCLFLQATCCLCAVLSSPILPAHLMLKSDDGTKTNRYAAQMRPSPSDDLPILPLVFPEDKQTQPRENDLMPHRLKKLLGDHFDPSFMSSVRPLESILRPNGTVMHDFENGHPRGRMPRELKSLSLNIPGRRRKIRIHGRRTRKRMQRFLWMYSYCPVHYKWRDLGQRFWPRWIREGDCFRGRSCSIPSGMTCKPQSSTTKTILWWHCRRRKACKWIFIKYPIITKCSCGC